MRPNVRRHAFTLIELLVVVAIIAILIALLMPSLGRARQQARAILCGGHLRSLGQAMHTYASEYNSQLPYGLCESGPKVGSNWKYVTWDDLLNPYLGGFATQTQLESISLPNVMPILTCPDDRFDRSAYYTTFRARSYAMVHVGDGTSPWYQEGALGVAQINYPMTYAANPNFRCFKLTEIAASETCILLAEKIKGKNILGHFSDATIDRPFDQMSGDVDCLTEPVHQGKFNYLIVDGHVEMLRPAETIRSPKTISSYQANYMWRRDGSN